MTVAAIIALVGTVVSLLVFLELRGSSLTSLSSTSMNHTMVPGPSVLYFLGVTLGITLVASLLELVFFHRAFRTLAPLDSRFSTPTSMVLVAAVGLVIVGLSLGLLLGQIYHAVECVGAGQPLTAACLNLGALLGLIVLVGIGAIIAVIGYVGLLVGIWRLGNRYGQEMFNAGAVLLLFPLLSVVGVFLILFAARSARGKLPTTSPNPV
ncbi:MAG: DUF973 family protein [Thermoplasmata archaeon]